MFSRLHPSSGVRSSLPKVALRVALRPSGFPNQWGPGDALDGLPTVLSFAMGCWPSSGVTLSLAGRCGWLLGARAAREREPQIKASRGSVRLLPSPQEHPLETAPTGQDGQPGPVSNASAREAVPWGLATPSPAPTRSGGRSRHLRPMRGQAPLPSFLAPPPPRLDRSVCPGGSRAPSHPCSTRPPHRFELRCPLLAVQLCSHLFRRRCCGLSGGNAEPLKRAEAPPAARLANPFGIPEASPTDRKHRGATPLDFPPERSGSALEGSTHEGWTATRARPKCQRRGKAVQSNLHSVDRGHVTVAIQTPPLPSSCCWLMLRVRAARRSPHTGSGLL